ncbi:MAG: hypothetical protein RI897_3950 [Verrucomicrobiota bacterium]
MDFVAEFFEAEEAIFVGGEFLFEGLDFESERLLLGVAGGELVPEAWGVEEREVEGEADRGEADRSFFLGGELAHGGV